MSDRAWVVGQCWRCETQDVPVMYLGAALSQDEGNAPFYACAPCMERMEALIRAYHDAR